MRWPTAAAAGGVAGVEGAGSTGGADVQLDRRHGLSPVALGSGAPGAGAAVAGSSPVGRASSSSGPGGGVPR